ncbi:2643_t:CDS:2, partial [Rhizophagus irregularis]
ATLRDETNISTQPVRREANQIQHSDSQNIATCLGRSLGSHKREASPIEEQAVKNNELNEPIYVNQVYRSYRLQVSVEDFKTYVMDVQQKIWWQVDTYKADACKALEFINMHFQHNVIKNLILGDCDHLTKYILFGNDNENRNNLHIPRDTFWKRRKWIPKIMKYGISNLSLQKKIFRKECFGDSNVMIPIKYRVRRNEYRGVRMDKLQFFEEIKWSNEINGIIIIKILFSLFDSFIPKS